MRQYFLYYNVFSLDLHLQISINLRSTFLVNFFHDALCLKRSSLICSFHFTKRLYRFNFYLLFVTLSLSHSFPLSSSLSLPLSLSLYLSPSFSLFPLLLHLMQIYGRFSPCSNTSSRLWCASDIKLIQNLIKI